MRIFYFLLLLSGITFFSSCGNDDDSADEATAITISADTTMAQVGETFTFTVRTDRDEDVTSSSTITLNNTVLESNTFTPNETGAYDVKASYNNLVSTTHYEVVVIDQKPSSIEVTTDTTALKLGEVFTFRVMTDLNTDVTYESVIEVDGEALEREKFIPEQPGTFTVTATYDGLNSSPLEVEVLPNSIVLSADNTTILLGDSFTFTATADDGTDITENTTIEVDGNPVNGNVFEPEETGIFTATATYGELETELHLIVLSEEGNFFTLEGANYETPVGSFAYMGTFPGENGSESIWAFNPFLEIDNGDGTFSYPNDLYIYFAVEQVSETDLVFPPEGFYTYQAGSLPEIIDAEVFYDDNVWIEPGDSFESITLYITGMNPWSDGGSSAEQIAYSITKTDGSTVTGQYSGPLFAWDASGKGSGKEKIHKTPLVVRPETFKTR